MRRWLVALSLLLLLPMFGSAQSINYYPPPNSTSLTDGSASAPAFSFTTEPDMGMFRLGSNILALQASTNASNSSLEIRAAVVYSRGPATLGIYGPFAMSDPLGNNVTTIGSEAANTLQIAGDAATATAQTFKGPDSTGANVTGANLTIRAGAGTSGNATGGNLILGGGANAGSGARGVVTIEDGGTKPTCASGIRGALWYDAGAGGVKDTFEVCAKDAGDAYAWRVLY